MQPVHALATVAADYIDRITLVTGHEFANPRTKDEVPQNLDHLVPPERALTLRLLSAWSSKDPDTFTAMLAAATADPVGRAHVRDLFIHALHYSERLSKSVSNPRTLVLQLCNAISAHGPSSLNWTRP